MNAVLEQINSIGKAFVEFAVPMLVQSGVLIVILLLVDLALRKKVKAVFRYCIWMLVLIKLILPTSLSSPLSLGYWFGDHLAYVAESRTSAAPEAEALEPALANMLHIIEPVPIEEGRLTPAVLPDVETSVTEAVSPPAVSVTPVTWQGVVFLLWLAVVMALGLLLLQRAMFVRGLVAQAKEANDLMNDALKYCCKCMGVKRKVGLKVSANATSPAVCGLFRPVILLPHKLAPSLGSRGLRAVLLHELAHIRRGDLWVNLVQTVLQIGYFYNPLLWLANCVIRRVREQAIDETVLVAMGEKAQQYPQTLVNVAKLAFKRPVLSLRLIGVVESKSALAGRIKHILNRPMPKSAKVDVLGLAAVLIIGAILLPMAKAAQLTDHTRQIMKLAKQEARQLNHKYIGTEHILLALVKEGRGVSGIVLRKHDVNMEKVRSEVRKLVRSGPEVVVTKKLPKTPRAKRAMKYAKEEAKVSGHDYIGAEHILLGLLREKDAVAAQVLMKLGLKLEDARQEVLNVVGPKPKKGGYPTLVISGVVTDAATGNPIVGARVGDDGYGPKPYRSAVTGSDGRYYYLTWPEHHGIKAQAAGYKVQRKSLYEGHFTFNKEMVEEVFDFALEAGRRYGYDHFVGKYAIAGHPDKAAFEITKKGDVFIFSDLGGPKFEMSIFLRGLEGRKFEMEKGRDNLKFGDNPRDRFRVRYKPSENRYILDKLGMRGEVQDAVISLLTELIKISADKPEESDVRVGIEKSISPKLTMLLGVINSCAAETKLNIESVSIKARKISIVGDTSGRTNTQKFLDAIRKNELKILQLRLDARGNRDKFSMIVEPKKNWQQWRQRHKTGIHVGVEETISPKLVMLLGAINSCAAETKLNIESISIKARDINIAGDTSGRTNTQKFLDAIKKNGLEILRLSLDAKGNRDRFSIIVEPKKDWQKWWQQHKTDMLVEVGGPTKEDAVSNPPQPELLSTTPPIFAYNVKLNFADPTVRDGTFHSEQSVAFSLSFHNIEIPPAGKFTLSHLLIGQTTWPVHLEDNGITIQEGVAGQKIRSLTWPAGESQFEKVITIPIKYGQKEYSCPVRVELNRRDKEAPIGSYWFCAYLSGRLPWGAGGRGFEIVNLDQQMEFRLTGDGSDPRDAALGIDIDGDGKIDPAKTGGEQFDLYEPFQIGPKAYRLTEVDPYLPRVVFRELALAESLLPSVKTDVQVEGEGAAAVSSESEVKPATTETRSGSELEFRIAPEHVLSSRAPSPLTIEEMNRYKRDLAENGPLASRVRGDKFAWFKIRSGANVNSLLVTGEYQGAKYLLLHNREPFVMLPQQGWRLVKAAPIKDAAGRPNIQFELDEKGAELFSGLTEANRRRALAIVIDGKVVSAPTVRAAIRNKGIIIGNFTEREAERIAVALRKGMLAGEKSDPALDEVVAARAFEELSVKFSGIWMHWQDVEFTVRGDGSVQFSMNKGPKDKTRYKTAFKLSGEHLAELSGLLQKTNWLTAPGANVQPRFSDATRIDMKLVREGKTNEVWCHDRNAEPYLSLIIFLKRIHRQEYLLYQMTVPGGTGRNSAFSDVYQQIRAEKGEPVSAHPHRILDFSRFIRPSIELIGHPDENHYETVAIAAKILGKLKAEQVRPQITDLTTAERKEHHNIAAVIRTEHVRAAAVEALTEMGGEQSRRHVRDMAKNHRSWRRVVNEALVESLLELDKDNCAELLKDMAAKTREASWGLIRLRPAALPAIVEILEVRDIRYMGQIYLIRQYIDRWKEVTKPIDPRVIEAVQRNLDYRLGYGPTWTQYHKEFLQLAGASELPSKDARQIAEEFLAAVKTNDQMTIGAVARTRSGNWPQRLAKLKSLPGLQQLKVTEVYADKDGNIGMVVALDNSREKGARVSIYLNFLSNSVWRVVNIAVERPEIGDRMTRRFLEKYPDAKLIPAKVSSGPGIKSGVKVEEKLKKLFQQLRALEAEKKTVAKKHWNEMSKEQQRRYIAKQGAFKGYTYEELEQMSREPPPSVVDKARTVVPWVWRRMVSSDDHLTNDEKLLFRKKESGLIAKIAAFGRPAIPLLIEKTHFTAEDAALLNMPANGPLKISGLSGEETILERKWATMALSRIGKAAVPELLAALKNEDGWVRSYAARVLGNIKDKSATEPLIECLADKEKNVRFAAARALVEIADTRAVQALVKALKDDDSNVRWPVVEGLGKFGDSTCIQPLEELKRRAKGDLLERIAQAVQAIKAREGNEPGPKITFEKTTHDFGQINPGTQHSCEFKFTNTGDGLLKIGEIHTPCNCTVPMLKKKEYTPGESGTIKVTYKAGSKTGVTSKQLYISSKDKKNPRVTLTIKARIAVKVEHKPERLNLLLKDDNAGCPEITLTGLDNQPFAITQFKSTANSITADFEPSVKKTKFVIRPKVDVEKLRRALNGRISISLTHPQCRTVTIPFSTLPRFKITPPSLITLKAESQKPTKRKVRILNNYNEDFEIESASSQKGIVKVLSQEKTRGGYQFELEITPPVVEGNKRLFTDVFIVNIKGGEVLKISCRGFYSRK